MIDYDGRTPFDEPAGREIKGWGPLYHCYEAADGWFFLALDERALPELARLPGLGKITGLEKEQLQAVLAECFLRQSLDHWSTLLQGIDAGFAPLATLQALREENLWIESEGQADLKANTYSFVRHDLHPSSPIDVA
jgi:crotonobetainyl-CoA:carnitine CoA-transferase CaiB-like acyl-CoA transferase